MYQKSTFMSKFSFRGKILESESAWLHFDETDIFQADDILALVLSSALESAKESWLSLSTPGWREPRRLRAGRGHLSKSPREQAQDTGSCHRKLQRNYTHRGAFQPHQVQLCRKMEAPDWKAMPWLQRRPEPTKVITVRRQWQVFSAVYFRTGKPTCEKLFFHSVVFVERPVAARRSEKAKLTPHKPG